MSMNVVTSVRLSDHRISIGANVQLCKIICIKKRSIMIYLLLLHHTRLPVVCDHSVLQAGHFCSKRTLSSSFYEQQSIIVE
jgi:hypothetical protein